ncbi:hypothetical protein [Microbacterium sp. NC79]|uniref:hypothetical protein n=1 Tax=Microbacterium sp. NC79 TaxID=2851009 RepID=UPI001C2C449F|nr:hypothetical protein [Microbacterium sp. NC79]MBV0895952.1 hypothetical protein [Microbacterium sp. NC79]
MTDTRPFGAEASGDPATAAVITTSSIDQNVVGLEMLTDVELFATSVLEGAGSADAVTGTVRAGTRSPTVTRAAATRLPMPRRWILLRGWRTVGTSD